MPTISAAIDNETDSFLAIESQNTGLSKSALIRKIIKNGITGAPEPNSEILHRREQLPAKKELTEEDMEKQKKDAEKKKHEELMREKEAFQEVYREDIKEQNKQTEILRMLEKMNTEIEQSKNEINQLKNENVKLKSDIKILDTNCKTIALNVVKGR